MVAESVRLASEVMGIVVPPLQQPYTCAGANLFEQARPDLVDESLHVGLCRHHSITQLQIHPADERLLAFAQDFIEEFVRTVLCTMQRDCERVLQIDEWRRNCLGGGVGHRFSERSQHVMRLIGDKGAEALARFDPAACRLCLLLLLVEVVPAALRRTGHGCQ